MKPASAEFQEGPGARSVISEVLPKSLSSQGIKGNQEQKHRETTEARKPIAMFVAINQSLWLQEGDLKCFIALCNS